MLSTFAKLQALSFKIFPYFPFKNVAKNVATFVAKKCGHPTTQNLDRQHFQKALNMIHIIFQKTRF